MYIVDVKNLTRFHSCIHKSFLFCFLCSSPPSSAVLHDWKQKRATIGSQCSWLALKIASLDKKIMEYHQIHKKLKTDRQSSRMVHFENLPKINLDKESNEKNGFVVPNQDEHMDGGCSRVCSVFKSTQHKYIKRQLENSKTRGYTCRCLSVISPCRLCLQTETVGSNPMDSERILAGKLDQSYHSTLSYKNGKFLFYVPSFFLFLFGDLDIYKMDSSLQPVSTKNMLVIKKMLTYIFV